MILMLFKTNSPAWYLNKSLTPLISTPINATRKHYADGNTITVSLQTDTNIAQKCNYVYVSDTMLQGYFFVTDRIIDMGGLVTFTLQLDVLDKYANDIRHNMQGVVKETDHRHAYIPDGTFITECREEVQQIDYPEGFDLGAKYILITSGGAYA